MMIILAKRRKPSLKRRYFSSIYMCLLVKIQHYEQIFKIS